MASLRPTPNNAARPPARHRAKFLIRKSES
jgi:hypothetical protein